MTRCIHESDLFDIGFKLGPLGYTYRLDGIDSNEDWYYIQVELSDNPGTAHYRVYADSLPFSGNWCLMERGRTVDTDYLRELVADTIPEILGLDSKIRQPMPLSYYEIRT